ncbi:MAG: hypothetical protein CL908_09695 [Deltaproteobacteria bacterium]|nr:hypothetical protein [Deltaproteobacteria bacterium]
MRTRVLVKTGLRGLLLGCLGLLPLLGPAAAELRKVEAVGIFGIRQGARTRVIPRDEAIDEAIWEGVSRVALEVIGEAAPSAVPDARATDGPSGSDAQGIDGFAGAEETGEPSADEVAGLRGALGEELLPYTRGYRILEDRGEVPVLFEELPDVFLEYVVVLEVVVDVDRVSAALETAGLIAPLGGVGAGGAIQVELVGLSRYEALLMVVGALEEELGATRVQTVEFARDRQVLMVEGPLGPEALSAGLAALERVELVLEPIGVDPVGRQIRLLGQWFPAPTAESGTEADEVPAPGG